MQAKLATAVLLGFVLVAAAACGRSDGLSTAEEEALQERLEAAELEAAEAERLRQAEEAARAEAERQAAEAERLRLEEEAAREEAERLRQEEEAAREEAERQAAEAERLRLEEEAAREEAERLRREEEAARAEAERLRREEEAARQAAEAERQRLANEAEQRRRADATERARTAIAGTRTIGATSTLAVGTIEYGEPAPVTVPQGPFMTSTGRSGSWSTTSLTRIAEPERDMIQIYSDVEADKRELFSGSPLNTGTDVGPTGTTNVIDGTNMVVGWVNIMNAAGGADNHSRIAASGSFPREIGTAVPFSLADRGLTETAYNLLGLAADGSATDADLTAAGITRAQYNQYRQGSGFRDDSRFPERWAYETSGTLQGASGRYRCNSISAPTATTCTVQNRGGSFEFGGDWDFIPSSGSVQIVVPDAEYMWFGVWARQTVRLATPPERATEIWAFQAKHGGNSVGTFADATGTATYRGPAFGRYAVYEPDTGDSAIGTFTASATLEADFDATPNNTVSGTIRNFSNDSSWSLALNQKDVAAAETGTVTWTIDGVPDDGGTWEAAFYSNLEHGGTITYQPHGIAGTFEAAYDPSGAGDRAALIGGFGAHR